MLKPAGRILMIFLLLSLSCSMTFGAPQSAKAVVIQPKLLPDLNPEAPFGLINGIVANNVRKCLARLPESLQSSADRSAAQSKVILEATKQLFDQELLRCGSLEDPTQTVPSSFALCIQESQKQGPIQAQQLATEQSIGFLTTKLGAVLWTELAACLAPLQIPSSVWRQILDGNLESEAAELILKNSPVSGQLDASVKGLVKDIQSCYQELKDGLAEQVNKLSAILGDIKNALTAAQQEVNQAVAKCFEEHPFTALFCATQEAGKIYLKLTVSLPKLFLDSVSQVNVVIEETRKIVVDVFVKCTNPVSGSN